jgi:hypothetical protein
VFKISSVAIRNGSHGSASFRKSCAKPPIRNGRRLFRPKLSLAFNASSSRFADQIAACPLAATTSELMRLWRSFNPLFIITVHVYVQTPGGFDKPTHTAESGLTGDLLRYYEKTIVSSFGVVCVFFVAAFETKIEIAGWFDVETGPCETLLA